MHTIAMFTSPAKPSASSTSRFEKRMSLRRSASSRGTTRFWVRLE